MPVGGNHDRPETSSSDIAHIEIGKPVLHRMEQSKGCIRADEVDGDELARQWHWEKGKYVCIPYGYGIAVSEGPVPRFPSQVGLGQWFEKACTNQKCRHVRVANHPLSLVCSYSDYLLGEQDVRMKSYSINGNKIGLEIEITGLHIGGFRRPGSGEWTPVLEIPIRGLPDGDYEIEVFWQDNSAGFREPNPTISQWISLHVHRH